MTERLIIRLASQASQKSHWLLWSDIEQRAIASGQVECAEALFSLTEKAQQNIVVCLLPNVDVCIHKVEIKGAFNHQMQQALPYLIEDELASDVDQLHFSVLAKEGKFVQVAVCEKQKIAMWLGWLEDALISCKQFIPEGFALPIGDEGEWRAAEIDNNWIIRENSDVVWGCEAQMLDMLLKSKQGDDTPPKIKSYSQHKFVEYGDWTDSPVSNVMEVLARGVEKNKINILTGEFKPKSDNNQRIKKWKMPAILFVVLFLISTVNLYIKNVQVEKNVEQVRGQVESVYKQAFPQQPKLRYVRVKKKIKAMLLGTKISSKSGFLTILNGLVPALKANPDFKINKINFDNKKQEMKISASADNFNSFGKFSAALETHFDVEQSALNKSEKGVTGMLTIGVK